jgi:hypothetical protein
MGLIITATVALVTAVTIGVIVLSDEETDSNRQPKYDGKPLSYWIEKYCDRKDKESTEALSAIGTNAFPFLIRWICTTEPKYRDSLRPIAKKLPRHFRPNWANDENKTPRSTLAAFAFDAFGNQAASLVPELTRLAADAQNRDPAKLALVALAGIGSAAVPALLAAARDPAHPHRAEAIYWLARIRGLDGPNTDIVVTELIAQLEVQEPSIKGAAVYGLSYMAARHDLVVPALIRCLERTNSAADFPIATMRCLVRFGEKAQPALPYLTDALRDPDSKVRKEAARTIQRIHGTMIESREEQ